MAAYNTVQDLLNALTAVANVDDSRDSRTKTDPDGWGYDLHLIEYLRSYPNSTLRTFQNWVAVKSDGTVHWWSGKAEGISGGIPSPLIPEGRDQYLTNEQYITAIENNFADWTVLEIQVQVRGKFDMIRATASNATDDRVISRTIVVWKDPEGATQWKLRE